MDKTHTALPEEKRDAEGNAKRDASITLLSGLDVRLKTVRERLGKTQSEMESLLGLGKNTWQNYEGRGQAPGSKVIAALVRLGFNANWILTGTGSMRVFQSPGPDDPPEGIAHITAPPANELLAYVGLSAEWLEASKIKGSDLVGVVMPDDGMHPTITAGGMVLVDSAQEKVDRAGLWVLQSSAATIVARVQPQLDGKLLVCHDNRLYQDMLIDPELIMVVGRVIWIGTPA